MATTNNLRNSKEYRAWRTRVLKHCEPVCIRCGYPVDMSLPSSHDDGPSADHEPPFTTTGDIAPGLDGSGIAHLKCNKQHGGRLGAQKTNTKPRAKTPKPFLDDPTHTPAAPSPLSPQGPRKGQSAPRTPEYHRDGFVLPRLETRPPATVRGSYGKRAAEWLHRVYGLDLRAWQRYALDRALEHDQDGRLIHQTVIITVGRQSGKSVLSRALCMWRLHNSDLFGEPQTILHVANKRDTAMEVMRPAGLWAVEQYGKKSVKWGNTAAGIELPTGDRWLIHAANESAGVGYSVSMVFADEAWKIKREVIDDALAPTMAERNMPQLYLVSTAGDSGSDLMQSYRSRAIDQLESTEPTGVLLLEWSAPPEADPDHVDTWRYASPEWTPKREAFLRGQWANVEESAWRREYLNQWVTRADHWLRDSVWTQTLDPDLQLPETGQWSVAVESDFDGMGHAVALAAVLDDGTIAIKLYTFRTMAEADQKLAEIRASHPRSVIHVTPTYAERINTKIDGLVGQREAPAATQNLLDLFDRRAIRHDGSKILQEHFAGSTISRRQGGWVLTAPMGRGGVYGARAVMFAAWQAAKTPKPVPMIRTRRRTA